MQHGDYPMLAEEWRLPHSPVPARPDFTRESRDRRQVLTERITRREKQQRQATLSKWDSLPELVVSTVLASRARGEYRTRFPSSW